MSHLAIGGNDVGAFRQRGLYDSGLMGGPPMTAINLRNLTAFHEAGHCVVAKFFGFVLSVNIVPDLAQDRLGICMARTAAWERERRSYLMFCVAGPIAELIRRCRGIGWLGVHMAVKERGLLEILRLMGGAT